MLWLINWNFVFYFISLYYRSSSSVINLRQVLWELCPFWNLEYWKNTVFRTFLLHALTYWAEILPMLLFYCTTDQDRVFSICVNFWRSYTPFGTENTENSQFSALFSYTLWHIKLKFCICADFCGSYAPFGSQNTGNPCFLHFSPTCFDILSWNFTYDFV